MELICTNAEQLMRQAKGGAHSAVSSGNLPEGYWRRRVVVLNEPVMVKASRAATAKVRITTIISAPWDAIPNAGAGPELDL